MSSSKGGKSKTAATTKPAKKPPTVRKRTRAAAPAQAAEAATNDPADQQLTAVEELFAQTYLACGLNATEAYQKAHPDVKRTTASTEGVRWLGKPWIARRIAELAHERAQELEIDGKALLHQANAIANADHRHLSQYIRTCCRHCYGEGFRYQRTVGEMERDRKRHEEKEHEREAKAMLRNKDFEPREFDEEGGDGYDGRKDPNPDCPECFGHGVGRLIIADTRKLPPDAAILYAGVEETKDGLRVRAHDKQKAQDMLFKHKGLYEKDNAQKVQPISPEALTAMAATMEAARKRQLETLAERRGQFPGD